ncbi:S10 family serine carboxypeptidase-like protein [Trinickia dinghuensis]|uniref:Peptidase S10 n=1 Tax=Trinickia dinghuensis TaxID=2291023 RepID=A0A3D8JW89_9BURK|nr:peptidase S10 [Trinickia dinghuensis]RDU97413.1 peptidase S10 [Trinickia dinghuensis]
MKSHRSRIAGRHGLQVRLAGLGALTFGTLLLAACGGGSGSPSAAAAANAQQQGTKLADTNQPYTDQVAYSENAGDSLDPTQVNEGAAVMHYQWTSGATTVNYTTTTGHLTASDANGNPEASMSYVAYTAPSTNGKPRPVTFFYNGGPGSSSIWLRLGSFAPTRVATPDPLLTNWPNFPLVNNAESLIATTDMVFIDPPGTGLSEAVSPNTNQSFWGCDEDVNVMRDFIRRYIAANNRTNSPIYLYGESYGTPRTDMLALSLETAGVPLTGIVLQSAILNYFADATEAVAVTQSTSGLALATDTLSGYFPGYAEVAAYFNQALPAPASQSQYAQQMENFVTSNYNSFGNYAQSWTMSQIGDPNGLGRSTLPSKSTLTSWESGSSLTYQALKGYFSTTPFQTTLLPGTTIGRYDGRVSLPNSDSRLQSDGDPSDILITQPFTTTLQTQMPDYLGYTAPNATYMPLNNNIIGSWDFTHDGQALPDTIPDLLGALQLNPNLQVLSINGYHDLATPFFNTEKQLARLQTVQNLGANVQVTFYPGGHMVYLDDTARPQMQADLQNYFSGKPIPSALSLSGLPSAWADESPAGTPTVMAQASKR